MQTAEFRELTLAVAARKGQQYQQKQKTSKLWKEGKIVSKLNFRTHTHSNNKSPSSVKYEGKLGKNMPNFLPKIKKPKKSHTNFSSFKFPAVC